MDVCVLLTAQSTALSIVQDPKMVCLLWSSIFLATSVTKMLDHNIYKYHNKKQRILKSA